MNEETKKYALNRFQELQEMDAEYIRSIRRQMSWAFNVYREVTPLSIAKSILSDIRANPDDSDEYIGELLSDMRTAIEPPNPTPKGDIPAWLVLPAGAMPVEVDNLNVVLKPMAFPPFPPTSGAVLGSSWPAKIGGSGTSLNPPG